MYTLTGDGVNVYLGDMGLQTPERGRDPRVLEQDLTDGTTLLNQLGLKPKRFNFRGEFYKDEALALFEQLENNMDKKLTLFRNTAGGGSTSLGKGYITSQLRLIMPTIIHDTPLVYRWRFTFSIDREDDTPAVPTTGGGTPGPGTGGTNGGDGT